MIIGAGITRYLGWEGSIHIREGEEQNTLLYRSEIYRISVTISLER